MNITITTLYRRSLISLLLFFILAGANFNHGFAYTVSNIATTYRSGQVFITWTNPGATNLQYNVYRSTSKIKTSAMLETATYLGYVRDNSGKNIQLSQDQDQDAFYRIQDLGTPLASNQGLYVATCTNDQSYYYAVTVTNLTTSLEDKTIIMGSNSRTYFIKDKVEKPKPVLQDSIYVAGDMKYRYVQFVNNQETPLYPAMHTYGSYGFNLYIAKRGTDVQYPLIAVYEGSLTKVTFGVGLSADVTNCYILGLYDWLPIPTANTVGENSYFFGYHENFNCYNAVNPVPTTGVVRSYTQKRCIEAIRWAKTAFPVQETQTYTKGNSATGFGAVLTSVLYPEEIAASFTTVEPMVIKPTAGNGTLFEEMWGLTITNLSSDVMDPVTQTANPVFTALDIRKLLFQKRNQSSLPLIFDVHGKKDTKVTWGSIVISWLDTVQSNKIGGVFYWDQRNHSGNGKNFLPEEITPDFDRYKTSKSYPAFTNCSIDPNPGDGNPDNGTLYGGLNCYLDWDDDITDEVCKNTTIVFIKDYYVGGVLDPVQYNTCTADITYRRLQNFNPPINSTITWKNYDSTNTKIQSGSFVYTGGLITLTDIIISHSRNRITMKIQDCGLRDADADADEAVETEQRIYFSKSNSGYTAHVEVDGDEEVVMNVYDLVGRVVNKEQITMSSGTNTFNIPSPGFGIYLVELRGTSFSHTQKLMF